MQLNKIYSVINVKECKIRRRLLEMGFIPNTKFRITKISPFGGPILIHIREYYISLRVNDFNNIIFV